MEGSKRRLTEDRLEKIALIGATNYEYSSPKARVESFPWDRLETFRNLATTISST